MAGSASSGSASCGHARCGSRASASSTSAVVPIFSRVANGDMLASPMMTWKRRYRRGLACGSSRVLTIGRRCIVSTLCSSLKKSLRCAIWKSGRDKPVLLLDGEFARARDKSGA